MLPAKKLTGTGVVDPLLRFARCMLGSCSVACSAALVFVRVGNPLVENGVQDSVHVLFMFFIGTALEPFHSRAAAIVR